MHNNPIPQDYLMSTGIINNKVTIRIKPGYTLTGKVTIPATFNGMQVAGIAGGTTVTSQSAPSSNGFNGYASTITAIF